MIDAELSKPTCCPRCDYELRGLPEVGICPECGEPFNRDFIILRGRPVTLGDEPNRQRGTSIGRISWNILGAGATALFAGPFIPPWMLFILLAYLGLEVSLAILIATASAPRRYVIVWISSAGVGEQPLVEGDTLAGRILRHASFVGSIGWFPLFVSFWVLSPGGDALPLWCRITVVSSVVVFMFASYLVNLGRATKHAVPPRGIRPALLPWQTYRAVELEDLGHGTFQLWTRKSNRTRPGDIVKIEFFASRDATMQLCGLLQQWVPPRIPVTLKPVDLSRGPRWARKLGLLVHRVLPKSASRLSAHE